jgi:hypothetical protein
MQALDSLPYNAPQHRYVTLVLGDVYAAVPHLSNALQESPDQKEAKDGNM